MGSHGIPIGQCWLALGSHGAPMGFPWGSQGDLEFTNWEPVAPRVYNDDVVFLRFCKGKLQCAENS